MLFMFHPSVFEPSSFQFKQKEVLLGEVHSNGSSHRRDKKCKFLQKKIYHKPSCDEADEPVRNGQNLNEEKNAERDCVHPPVVQVPLFKCLLHCCWR